MKYAPEWEEEIEIKERYSAFLNTNVLLLLEILNPLYKSLSSQQKAVSGYLRICWAFLLLVGTTKRANTEKLVNSLLNNKGLTHSFFYKVRLQLFKFPKKSPPLTGPEDIPYVYFCWLRFNRMRYRSTVYITIKGKRSAGKGAAQDGIQNPFGISVTTTTSTMTSKSVNELSLVYRLDPGPRGCFLVQFSNSGKYLCCACADWVMFPIRIYDSSSVELVKTYSGHHDLVYELNWSEDDSDIITASSDGTAKIWQFSPQEKGSHTSSKPTESFRTFQHTCFVYCAKYHPVPDLR